MTMVATPTALAGGDSGELIHSAVAAFITADTPNNNLWLEDGQGFISSRDGVDPSKLAYIDMTSYYGSMKDLTEGKPPRTKIFCMTELGKVSIDSELGILPDPETNMTPTPEEASAIVFGAIDRLIDRMPNAA